MSSALTHLLGTLLALLKCLLTPVPGVVGGAGLFTALFQHLVASSLHSCGGGAEGSKSRFWEWVNDKFHRIQNNISMLWI